MRSLLLLVVIIVAVSCGEQPKEKVLPFESSKDYETKMILSHQEFLKKEKNRISTFIDSIGEPFVSTGTGLR